MRNYIVIFVERNDCLEYFSAEDDEKAAKRAKEIGDRSGYHVKKVMRNGAAE